MYIELLVSSSLHLKISSNLYFEQEKRMHTHTDKKTSSVYSLNPLPLISWHTDDAPFPLKGLAEQVGWEGEANKAPKNAIHGIIAQNGTHCLTKCTSWPQAMTRFFELLVIHLHHSARTSVHQGLLSNDSLAVVSKCLLWAKVLTVLSDLRAQIRRVMIQQVCVRTFLIRIHSLFIRL